MRVQSLRLSAFTALGPGSIPGQGTKIPRHPVQAKKLKNNNNIPLCEDTIDCCEDITLLIAMFLVVVFWQFPGSPVVRAPHSCCQGPGFDPWLGN